MYIYYLLNNPSSATAYNMNSWLTNTDITSTIQAENQGALLQQLCPLNYPIKAQAIHNPPPGLFPLLAHPVNIEPPILSPMDKAEKFHPNF